MKDYILNKIFNVMQEDIKIADSEYLSAKKKSYEIEKEMLTELSGKQQENLKELINTFITISYKESEYNFYNGFKIGIKIILESLF